MAKRWFVLRVQSGREDSICRALERRIQARSLSHLIYQVMVPKETIAEPISLKDKVKPKTKRKPKPKKRKIFPGYIMAEIEFENDETIPEDVWFLIKETPGIGDFLGGSHKPQCMKAQEVEDVLRRVEGAPEPAPIVQEQLEVGAKVTIIDGPFKNFVGEVEEVVPQKGTVKVVVDIWGRPTSVPLELWQVEPVT